MPCELRRQNFEQLSLRQMSVRFCEGFSFLSTWGVDPTRCCRRPLRNDAGCLRCMFCNSSFHRITASNNPESTHWFGRKLIRNWCCDRCSIVCNWFSKPVISHTQALFQEASFPEAARFPAPLFPLHANQSRISQIALGDGRWRRSS